ncbi:MAG TPA: hypothetical protein VGM19_00445 [Armatimonadota bacterium]|jgi:hypothetical protein
MKNLRRLWILPVLGTLLAACWASGAPAAPVTVTQQDGKYVLENDYLQLRVNPAQGGQIDRYLVKATGQQVVGDGCFLLGDHFWQQIWPGEFLSVPYEARVAAQSPESVTLEVSRVSQGVGTTTTQAGIRLIRRMTLTAGSPLLHVEITMENASPVGKQAGYWSQSLLYPGGRKAETPVAFRPSLRGVSMSRYDPLNIRYSFTAGEPESGFVHDPQQGWMAVLGAESHLGMAFVMRYDELMFLYNCMAYYTNEWQYNAVGLPVGKAWKTDFVLYPLAGLARVDYASRTLVAAVAPADQGGNLTVALQLAAADTPLTKVTVTPELILVRQGRQALPLPAQEIAQVGLQPTALSFSAPHDPAEPVVLRFRVQGQTAAGPVDESFETWFGAKYGDNRQVDGSPLYALAPPERHVTFLKPDRIEKTRNATPRVLLCQGPFAKEYLPSGSLSAWGAQVTPSYFSPAGTWPAQVSYFPASYEDLMGFDVIAVLNVDTAALGAGGQEMLKDFVTHGGTLLYGGDLWAYSRGHLIGSPLADLLPVTCVPRAKGPGQLEALGAAPVQVVAGGQPLAAGAVMEYATERFTLKPGARALLTCPGRPVAVVWKVGEGRVIALTGTALGDAPAGQRLFTRTREWRDLLSKLLAAPPAGG